MFQKSLDVEPSCILSDYFYFEEFIFFKITFCKIWYSRNQKGYSARPGRESTADADEEPAQQQQRFVRRNRLQQ
jgi:hypothetical protein